jgi:hypothetical protein
MTQPIIPPRPLVAKTTGFDTAVGCGDGVLIFGATMAVDAVAMVVVFVCGPK